MNKRSGLCAMVFGVCVAMLSTANAEEPDAQAPAVSLTMQDAIRMALAHSPEVAIAQAQSLRAEQALREAKSLNHPVILAGTGIAYNNGFPLSIEGSAPSIFQIGVNQPIFSNKNSNLIHEAEESNKASQFGPESARNDLAARASLVYYQLNQARKLIALWSSRLEAAGKDRQIVETLLQAGKARPLDVTLAKTAASFYQQQLLVAREQARIAETELRDMTGASEETSIQTLDPQFSNPIFETSGETLYQRALETHPDIRQAEALIRSKEFHVKAEKADTRPRFEAVSQYALFSKANNYADYFNRFTRNNFILGLSIQVPLFNGYQTGARVGQSRQEVDEAAYRLLRMKSDLRLGIERSLSALRVAGGALELALSEVEAAKESLQVNETLFEGGRIGPKEMEAAKAQLLEKEIAQIEADGTLFEKKVELLRLTGMSSSPF